MKKNIEISSNSSMIELKAELMKKKQEYEESKRNKSAIKLTDKASSKSNSYSTESKVQVTPSQLEEDQLKKSREALEAKSRLYNRLERGKMMENELSAGQRENLMVDFTWKGWNPETEDFEFDAAYSDSSESESDGLSVKGPLKMDQVIELLKTASKARDQEWIEYEDEFGRTRISKLIDLRSIKEEREELRRSLNLSESTEETRHYDGDAEIRNKGVAFYQFARDESERQRQMRELRKLREETVEKRMRILILREERRLRIESRMNRLKERRSINKEIERI